MFIYLHMCFTQTYIHASTHAGTQMLKHMDACLHMSQRLIAYSYEHILHTYTYVYMNAHMS